MAKQEDDTEDTRIRVLHLVSADGKSAPDPLLIPLLTRSDRKRVANYVVAFTSGDARFAVLRQRGLPVHEVPFSRASPSPAAILQIKKIMAEIQPDVLHVWGHSAQVVAGMFLTGGKDPVPMIWSISRTHPVLKRDGWLERRKLALNVKFAKKCSHIVYPSAVAAANFRRAGMPEDIGTVIAAGVDAERFKPDDAARQKFRTQFEVPQDAVLVGMYAPFAPDFDHATLMKAVGELIKINPNVYCVLAGRAMVKGNAALTTIVGGGVVGTRTRLIGEWTDMSALFNACDVVCSTAKHDAMRLTLAIAMLCGSMAVGTAVGAQGEVLGPFGATVEQGSADAVVRGIRRMLDIPVERKVFVAQSARKHVMQNFNISRSIDKYQDLYRQLTSEQSDTDEGVVQDTATDALPPSEAEVAALEAIAVRVRSTVGNISKPPKKESNEVAPIEAPSEFGSVKAAAPIKQAHDAPAESKQAAATNEQTVGESAEEVKPKPKDDFIDFEVLAVDKPKTAKPIDIPEADVSAKKNPEDWLDNEPTIMHEVLVEADPDEVKANEEKAAAAAKAAAEKAAASAALAAALAAGDHSNKSVNLKSVDPRVLAAVPKVAGSRK